MSPLLDIRELAKRFGDKEVLKSISLAVNEGEFLTILGESGSGKTTLLRLIAGFELPTSGEIWLGSDRLDIQAPFQRPVNTVFQHYALFPHMNVSENVAYGLKVKGVAKSELRARAREALDLVKMRSYESASPQRLSGGQQQRVALARALVNRPKILLLDEPLSALDANLRQQMQFELKTLQKNLGITFLLVTHDQNEAMALSDRIVLLKGGELEQVATPQDIYERPASSYTAQFIGQSNLLHCRHQDGFTHWQGLKWPHQNFPTLTFSLRPERIFLSDLNAPSEESVRFRAQIKHSAYEGSTHHLHLVAENGAELRARVPSQASFGRDTEFWFSTADLVAIRDSRAESH